MSVVIDELEVVVAPPATAPGGAAPAAQPPQASSPRPGDVVTIVERQRLRAARLAAH
jgi:hypothetical protein